MTLIFDLLTPKVDHLMRLPRGTLVPISIHSFFAVARCLSVPQFVRLSVRLSHLYCVETAKHILELFHHHAPPF